MGRSRKTNIEDLKLMDKYMGPGAKGLDREAIFDMMAARGLGNDATATMIASYNHARAGELDAVMENKSASELLKNHLTELFGAEEKEEEKHEEIAGQISMEEAMLVTEEDLMVAPERPEEADPKHVMMGVSFKTYAMLMQMAGFVGKEPAELIEDMIRQRYNKTFDAAMWGT